MLSTASQDLTNFINTGLTWKTVKKGVRSTSRRSRKPAKSLTVGVQLDDKRAKREDSSVSESEKVYSPLFKPKYCLQKDSSFL